MPPVAKHNLLPVQGFVEPGQSTGREASPLSPGDDTAEAAVAPDARMERNPDTGRNRAGAPRANTVARPVGLGRMLLTFGMHILVPLFLSVGMGLAYLGAFHAPTPQNLPVGIVGQGAASQVFAQTVTDESDGALVAHVVKSPRAAERRIRDRKLAAVYAPGTTSATLYVSTAASETTATAASKIFAPIAYKQKLPLRTVDVVAAGENDSTGQGLFFMLVALSIGGYASAIAVAAFASRLRLLWTTIVGVATGGVVAAFGTLIAGPIYGVITQNQWEIFLFSWMYVTGIIGIGVAFHPILGRWTTAVLTMLFVMLNFTSSGGIFQPAFQPGLFVGLNTFWNGASWLQAVQNLQYFPHASLGRSSLVLAIWLAASALLVVVVTGLVTRKSRLVRDREVSTLEEEETVAA